MNSGIIQPVIDFVRFPDVGGEDSRYGYATARVRALETFMLPRSVFVEMANAADFEQATEMLAGSEYSALQASRDYGQLETILSQKRDEVRRLFENLMIEDVLVCLIKSREDLANMRLAARRVLTGRPLGRDYSNWGNVSAEQFEEAFEQENYDVFPEYMQDAVEQAVLNYYNTKDVRSIDRAIDKVEAEYRNSEAIRLGSVFCVELFRMQVDLTNIRTMLRLKWAQLEANDAFLTGGYIENSRLLHCLDIGYEGAAALFVALPYYEIVEAGIGYLTSDNSFLRLEKMCDDHIIRFLKTTNQIISGHQPVIAYLLAKENEIRMVRMVLAGKKNQLSSEMILDRLTESY